MNYPIEVFIFTKSRDAIIYGHVFHLFLGFVALGVSFYLSWRVRRRIDYGAERFGAVFTLYWAIVWGTVSGLLLYAQVENYSELQNIYDTGSYSIAEGMVHVVHEQPAGGHARGDAIVVDDVEFEFSYFSESFGYHQTISHGGVLQEGARVRLTYIVSGLPLAAVRALIMLSFAQSFWMWSDGYGELCRLTKRAACQRIDEQGAAFWTSFKPANRYPTRLRLGDNDANR